MTTTARRWLLAAALVAATVTGACKKEEAAPVVDERPPALTTAEADRGRTACKAYVEQLCNCARVRNTPALAQECELNSGLPAALDMALQIDSDPGADMRAVSAAQDQITKIAARCIEQTAKLPGRGCP